MGLIDGLLSAGGDLVSGWMSQQATQRRQEDAQNFSAHQFATRYQTTVKDMEAAGLNPMLAYSQGGGTPPSGSAANPPAMEGLGSSYQKGASAATLRDNVEADTRNKNSMADKIEAETQLIRAQKGLTLAQEGAAGASADQSRANIGYLETQSKRIIEEIKNIPKEGDRLDALVKNLGQEYKLLLEKTQTQSEATKQLKWLAVKAMLEGDLLGLDLKAAESLDNLGRMSKEGRVVLDILKMLRK